MSRVLAPFLENLTANLETTKPQSTARQFERSPEGHWAALWLTTPKWPRNGPKAHTPHPVPYPPMCGDLVRPHSSEPWVAARGMRAKQQSPQRARSSRGGRCANGREHEVAPLIGMQTSTSDVTRNSAGNAPCDSAPDRLRDQDGCNPNLEEWPAAHSILDGRLTGSLPATGLPRLYTENSRARTLEAEPMRPEVH